LAAESPSARDTSEWRPVDAGGQWLPPGAPGSNWVANADSGIVVPTAATANAADESPRGRHWTPPEEAAPAPEPQQPEPEPLTPRARHSVPGAGSDEPAAETPPPPRHRGAAEEEPPRRRARDGEQTGGQSVADLLARLQANGKAEGGGRRRRRED
jgi:hypothetical protein